MRRILIADAGSSKTHWALLQPDANVVSRITARGINPVIDSLESIDATMQSVKVGIALKEAVSDIFFYGAGCATPKYIFLVKETLTKVFGDSNIFVGSDILGAAKSLFGNHAGIACILGTGSNAAVYDGERIVRNIPPLGYVLGDDGGGAALGKRFLGNLFKECCSPELTELFNQEFNLSLEDVIENVYRKPHPSAFLASFAPFIHKHIGMPEIKNMVLSEFRKFFRRNLSPLVKEHNLPVGFVGSLATAFSEPLQTIAAEFNLKLGKIISHPIEGLIKYHGAGLR